MSKYTIDCFTSEIGRFPENTYNCETPEEVTKIINDCSRDIAGISKIEVLINKKDQDSKVSVNEQEALSSFGRVTLSGKDPCPNYNGPAPCPIDTKTGMHEDYWVLPEADRKKGFIRPYRDTYIHEKCGMPTTMNRAIAETYARNPSYYNATFCASCGSHLPVGEAGEFVWRDGSKVGT